MIGTCRIDHGAALAIPAGLCRVCCPLPQNCGVAFCDGPAGCKDPDARPAGIAPSCWEEQQKHAQQQHETRDNGGATKEEVRAYYEQKRFAEFEQKRLENPELYAMDRKAKRDARRRVEKLGIKATGRRVRKVTIARKGGKGQK